MLVEPVFFGVRIVLSSLKLPLKECSHRTLLRRYPDFTDPRAALAAAEWELGQIERAEGDWNRVDDPRYADRQWLRQTRRWPARLCDALEAFLDVRSTGQAAPAVS